jgi:transcriptional regulator with XRE-family HTH domain
MSIDGEALRILREKDGYNQAAFAAAVEISPQYLGDIEAGRRTLKRNPGLIKKMADQLNVPMSMLEHRAPGEVVAS